MPSHITVHTGELLTEVTSGIIIQQVNAQGRMGSGIAKAIRDLYPKVWTCYSQFVPQNQEDQGLSQMGELILTRVLYDPDLWIANIVGQQFAGNDGKQYTSYEALGKGLLTLHSASTMMPALETMPIHFPMIGAGLGGGHWPTIKALIEANLQDRELHLWLRPGEVERT